MLLGYTRYSVLYVYIYYIINNVDFIYWPVIPISLTAQNGHDLRVDVD